MKISVDEIVLQIRKENREAYELLFLCLEKNIKYLARILIQELNILSSYRDDVEMIIKQETLKTIKSYEIHRSTFIPFWKLVVSRRFYSAAINKRSDVHFNNYDVSYENVVFEYEFRQENSLKKYIMRDEYEMSLSYIKYNVGEQQQEILRMWSEGYSYIDIAKKFNLSLCSIGNIVHGCLKKLKKSKDE